MNFTDRSEAGRALARHLDLVADDDVVVLGLARGGVPVAAEVARALDAELDVLVVRKLGTPWQPELGFGAISEGDVLVLDDELVARLGLGDAEVEQVEQQERRELERRLLRYRGQRDPVDLRGRTVVVIDDGIATGSTAQAALESVRLRGAGRVVLAVPVAARSSLRRLAAYADEFVCLHDPEAFMAVGEFYEDFSATTDEEVRAALDEARDGPRDA